MTRLLGFALLLPLTGCIIYDLEPKEDEGRGPHHDEDDTASGFPDDSGDPAEAVKFTLRPASAAAGEALIAHLTVEGDFDLDTVVDVDFSHGVGVAAMEAGEGELLLSLAIDAGAMPGLVDLVLYEADGRNEFVEGAFEVLPAQAGEDAGSDTGDCG